MNETRDHSTLQWIKADLDDTVNQARHFLEEYVEGDGADAHLEASRQKLNQLYGTLRMVQVYGAAMLVEEMQSVISAMMDGSVKQKESAAEALMLAMIRLPDYLEALQNGAQDVPMALLPLMNDLRAARDGALLTESAVFSPRMDDIVLPVQLSGQANPDLPQVCKTERIHFHKGLLGWFRDHDRSASLQSVQAFFDKVRDQAGTEKVYQIYWVAAALITAVKQDEVDDGVAIKVLMGKIDRITRILIESGEDAVSDSQFERLKDLLYYIGRANSQQADIITIQELYDLEHALPTAEELAISEQSLAAPNQDLISTVSAAINADLTVLKDGLDLFIRSDRENLQDLQALVSPIQKLADTLGMVGQGSLRQRLQNQTDHIKALIEAQEAPSDHELMTVASDILFVESSLANRMAAAGSGVSLPQAEDRKGLLPDGEYDALINATMDETRHEMNMIRDIVSSWLDDQSDNSLLLEVPSRLKSVAGVFDIMDRTWAGSLVKAISAYIQSALIDAEQLPDEEALVSFADAVIGFDYYVDAVKENRPVGEQEILAIVSNALQKLGVDVEAPAAREADEDEAPLLTETAADANDENSGDDLGIDLQLDEESIPELEEVTVEEREAIHDSQAELADELNFDLQETDSDFSLEIEDEAVDADKEEPDRYPELEAVDAPAAAAEVASDLEEDSEENYTPSASKPPLEDIDPEILDIFLEEAREELEAIREFLPQWQADQSNEEAMAVFRRSFHTLKGSGRLVGALTIGEFSWSIENLLNRVIDGSVEVTSDLMDVLDSVMLVLPHLIECQETGQAVQYDIQVIMDQAFALADGKSVDALDLTQFSADKLQGPEEPAPEESPPAGEFPATVEDGGEPSKEHQPQAAESEAEEEPAIAAVESTHELAELADSDAYFDSEYDASAEAVDADTAISLFAENEAAEQAEPAALSDEEADESSELTQIHLDDDLTETESSDVTWALSRDGAEPPTDQTPVALEMDSVLQDIFESESRSHIQTIKDFISECKKEGYSTLINHDVVRALHTLHGSAHMAEVNAIADTAAALERLANLQLDLNHVASADDCRLLEEGLEIAEQVLKIINVPATEIPHISAVVELAEKRYIELEAALGEVADSETTSDFIDLLTTPEEGKSQSV
ncbi:MAG: Hpt domain-containing protein, partial [gamma proteobacterium symbiont of Bathyaustriella thionipta]|nr:Hpt domain-containing protein [gamma proteobacterium symbiont of Bathyaustriella thionipta]